MIAHPTVFEKESHGTRSENSKELASSVLLSALTGSRNRAPHAPFAICHGNLLDQCVHVSEPGNESRFRIRAISRHGKLQINHRRCIVAVHVALTWEQQEHEMFARTNRECRDALAMLAHDGEGGKGISSYSLAGSRA